MGETMNRYKSYGKGWHFESIRHSLAARGILTRFKKEASEPIFGKRGVAEELKVRKMSEAKAKDLIVAGALSDLPKSSEEKMALRELELTLRPRERRGVRIMKLITQKISSPIPFESFDHYKNKVKGAVEEVMPLSMKVDVRLPVRGGSKAGVVTAEPPTAEEYIDYLLDHRYKEQFGFYDPSTKTFTAEYEGRPESFEVYGGRGMKSRELEKLSEMLEPIEEKKRKAELEILEDKRRKEARAEAWKKAELRGIQSDEIDETKGDLISVEVKPTKYPPIKADMMYYEGEKG